MDVPLTLTLSLEGEGINAVVRPEPVEGRVV
jgi:hypothetical protein